jgi:hypothetical protein
VKKTKKTNPKSITVIGRRWFDKLNGNTYCTATIYFDGKLVLKTPFEYGYGSFYIQNAANLLDKNKLLKLKRNENNNHESLWRYCERKKITLLDLVFEVKKKEL